MKGSNEYSASMIERIRDALNLLNSGHRHAVAEVRDLLQNWLNENTGSTHAAAPEEVVTLYRELKSTREQIFVMQAMFEREKAARLGALGNIKFFEDELKLTRDACAAMRKALYLATNVKADNTYEVIYSIKRTLTEVGAYGE